jgi:predicted DNA-binding transcriptional regulator YafY
MNRVDRLMGMLTVLQSHKFVMAEKLADKFEISVRTVYRDIKALMEIGIPISFENNRGYFIVQGYFLPPVSLTSNEANALILVAALANRFGDKTIIRDSEQAIQKIRAVLRQPDKEKTEHLSSRIKVLNPYPSGNNYLSAVQQAISEQRILKIEYTDGQQRKTNREVEPIGIIFYTEQWHMIAWCWKRNDYRDFKMNNIDSLVTTEKPFRKKDHITIDEHILSWK